MKMHLRRLTAILATGLLLGLSLTAATGAVLADDPEPVVFGVQRSTGEMWSINPITGTPTLLYTAPDPPSRSYSPGSPNGLAYDTDNDRLYYTEYKGAVDAVAALYFYDGVGQTYAGQVTGAVACADFYGDKYYYIAGNPTDDLYEVTFNPDGTVASNVKIDDITGNARAWTFGGDIAISPEGKLYGFGNRGGTFEFFSVDLDGSNFKLIKSAYTFALQLAFTADGTLYGHNSSGSGLFYTVDLASGVATAIAGSGAGKLYTDLSSGPRALADEPAIEIEKHTNGEDADDPTGPYIYEGEPVTWEYIVTNTGNVDLVNVLVTDDVLGTIGTIASLPAGASETLYAYGTAVPGQYVNVATASTFYDEIEVSDTDPSHYYGLMCVDETAWAADGAPGIDRFVPARGNWATFVSYTVGDGSEGNAAVFPLYAGQTFEAGSLLVRDNSGTLFVKYVASGVDSESGYMEDVCGTWTGLSEYHLQVVDEFDEFQAYRTYSKRTGYGSPVPGKFDLSWEGAKTAESDWLQIDISSLSDDLYIAAHAVMWWCECDPSAAVD